MLSIKTNTEYSVNGVKSGVLYYNDTPVGRYDTSPGKNIDLNWDDEEGQYMLQTMSAKFAEIAPEELKDIIFDMLKDKRIKSK